MLTFNIDTKTFFCKCDECKETTEYTTITGAVKNKSKCLFCRRTPPKTDFGRQYRKLRNNPTHAFRKWYRNNLKTANRYYIRKDGTSQAQEEGLL